MPLNPIASVFIPGKNKHNYIPVKNEKSYSIADILQTPKDFYRDGRKKAPGRIVKKQTTNPTSVDDTIGLANVVETPIDFYEPDDQQPSLQFKVSKGLLCGYTCIESDIIHNNYNGYISLGSFIMRPTERVLRSRTSPTHIITQGSGLRAGGAHNTGACKG